MEEISENSQDNEENEGDKWLGLKKSTRDSNPEGLLEREIRTRIIRDETPSRCYKKRKLTELTSKEIDEIISCYLTQPLTQDEVARKFRVSPPLVSKLYCQHKNDPDTETFSLSFAESDKQAQAVTLPARKKEMKGQSRQLKEELIK